MKNLTPSELKHLVPRRLDAIFVSTHVLVPSKPKKRRGGQTDSIDGIKRRLVKIGKKRSLDFVLITGNSYDWVRGRILDSDLLDHVNDKVNLLVLAENGLVAQSRKTGTLWIAEPLAPYRKAIDNVLRFANNKFPKWFYLQGNMKRLTLKPTIKLSHRFDKEFAPSIVRFARREGILSFDLRLDTKGSTGIIYHNKGSSLDIDPCGIKLRINGHEEHTKFIGKYSGIHLLNKVRSYNAENTLCIGKGKSDLLMFKAVRELGGHSFLPADNELSAREKGFASSLNVFQSDSDGFTLLLEVLDIHLSKMSGYG